MQRRNGGHQVHTGLPRVDQNPGRLQMQRAPATGGDALHEVVGTGLAELHSAQQPAVGNTGRVTEHAGWVGRAGGDVVGGAARRSPGWRRGQDNVNQQRGKRHREEPPRIRFPHFSVAQPQEAGDRIRHDEKRHVDRADDHFPPRRLRHLQAFLQPHRGQHPEEQPSVDRWLKLPKRGRPDQCGGAPAQVVQHQDKSKRQPVPDHHQHFAAAPNAGGDQSRSDIEQQQLTIECQPGGQAAIHHHDRPDRDGDTPNNSEPPICRRPSVTMVIRLDGGRARLARK
jgi:hypothetical protein